MAWLHGSAVPTMPVMPIDMLALCYAPLMPLGIANQMDKGYPITPGSQSSPSSEERKVHRRRRGGKAVTERRLRMMGTPRAEKRRDPTDGKMRSWEEFMMLHAQGACFNEADRLWAAAETADDDDGPPPLLDDEPDKPVSADTPERVWTQASTLDSSLSELSIGHSDVSLVHPGRAITPAVNEQ